MSPPRQEVARGERSPQDGHGVLVGPMNEVWVWSVGKVAQPVSVCDACELYT